LPDVKDIEAVRRRSRALFGGAQYRIEVGAAIADGDGITCLTDLAEHFKGSPGTASVNTELKVLEAAGLLTRATKAKGERRVFLRRLPSVYWELCQEIRDGTS
jgi:DNA-binding MarR family transcriptional regulator